jgi:hypothetical protein
MEEAMPKTIKLLLCFMLIAALLTACSGGKTAAYDISEYIAAFTAMDYAKMFSCSDPAVDIDQETFVAKYSAIFSGLGVTQVSVSDITGPDENGAFNFTAAYQTKDYGVFSNVFTLKTRIEEGKCLVLWDYSLIFPKWRKGAACLCARRKRRAAKYSRRTVRCWRKTRMRRPSTWTSRRCRILKRYRISSVR